MTLWFERGIVNLPNGIHSTAKISMQNEYMFSVKLSDPNRS